MNMKELNKNTYLFSSNAEFVEELYAEYLKKPTSVGEDWQAFFQQLQAQDMGLDIDHRSIRKELAESSRERRAEPKKLVAGNGSGGRQAPKGTPFEEPWMLFDLNTDPGERENVAKQYPDIFEQLKTKLYQIKGDD